MGVKAPHVMAVASAGGHWIQLTRLIPAWKDCRVTYVTTDPKLEPIVAEKSASVGISEIGFHTVIEANRWQKLRLLWSLLQIALLLLRKRPDVVITTGAAPGFFALRLGALMGIRTVWVDSIANADELSLSGRMAGRHASLWLTQWEHLSTPEGPDYHGSVV
ncbi:MAG: hypothetical protein Alpg2KO_33440 [Alphaproteobacteria bacterium]|jgi:UDP-N-acetylglucosamine:LPS N-acetylglucosamine transferase